MDSPGREERAARRQTRPGQRREGQSTYRLLGRRVLATGRRVVAIQSVSIQRLQGMWSKTAKPGRQGRRALHQNGNLAIGARRLVRAWLGAGGGGGGWGGGGTGGADGQAGQAEGGKASKAAATYPWGGGPWL